MESSENIQKKSGPSNRVILIAVLLLLAAVVAVGIAVVFARTPDSSPKIGYATEAKVMLDQDSLQAAMDEAMANAQNGNVALSYKNNAYSTNGTDFECYILNSEGNSYDMFLTIFADAEMTDQLFLSGLVPPGSGFESITLDRALENGDHRVYVVVTQVDTDENGEQVLRNQVVHTMDFHVTL